MGLSSQLAPSAIARPGVIANAAARPASPYDGQVIYQQDTDQAYVWNGSAWVLLSTGTANPPGLEFIKTGTVTNAADSGSTFRSIFTSSYDSYRVVCHTMNAHTNGAQPRMSLYYSTSTEQATGYYSAMNMSGSTTGTNVVTAVNNGAYVALAAACDSISGSSFSMDVGQVGATSVRGPNFVIQFQDNYTGAFGAGGALNINSRAFDGLRFFMSTGNISMTASVYGYRK